MDEKLVGLSFEFETSYSFKIFRKSILHASSEVVNAVTDRGRECVHMKTHYNMK